MSINERIREIRKDKNWNQKYLASILGITQSGVSYMEQNGSTVSDQTIKSICLAVPGLNEQWLREGVEPKYLPSDTFSLDQFVKDHNGTDLELEIMKAYFTLPPEIRQIVMEHFQKCFAQPAPVVSTSKQSSASQSVEDAEAEYKKNVLNSVQKMEFSLSNTTDDTKTAEKDA